MAGKRGGKGSKKKNSRRRGNNNRGGSNNVNSTNADGGGRQERLKEEEEEEDTTSANIDHQIVEEEGDYDLPAYPDPPPRKEQQQQQQQQQPQQHHQEQQQPLSQQRQGLEPPAGATFVPLSLVMNKRASEASSTVSSIDDPPGDYDTDPHPRSRSRSRSRRTMNGNDNNGNATRPTEYFSDPDQIIVGNNNDHDYHPTSNKRRSRSRNRQIDNDVDDGRVNDNNHWKRTQRGQHDIGIEDDPTSYSYSSEESKHSSYNKYYHPIRQHQEQQQQKQQQRRDSREDPKDWTEDEEGDEEEAEDYLQNQHEQKQLYQQQQKQHQKQEQQHDDHAFTQFNIQPLQQQRQQEQYYSSESRSSQDESEDEEAPLFFGTSNFTTASDTYASHHVKGVGWGVDYLLARAQRKRHEKQQERFEIEERREREEDNRQLWWWQDNNDDSYDEHDFDDVDFDGGYRRHSFVHRHMRGVKNVVLMAVSLVLAIAFFEMGSKTTQNNNPDAANLETESNHHGTAPSSRWGHRFDENRTSTKITAKEKEAELEKWEDYEMEVANVLAETASGGWDIHSKTGNATKDAEEKDGKNKKKNAEEEEGSNNNYANGYHSDGYSDHWVQFYDKSSEAYYYFHRETNATQWEKPAMVKGVALLGIAYGTQREYIIEEGGEVEGTGTGVPAAMGGSGKSVGNDDNKQTTTSISSMEEVQFNRSQKVLDHYAKSYWRWNHPYRIPARTDAWSGIDAPVFWRIPLSGSTTVEEILTHCYQDAVSLAGPLMAS